MCSVFLSRCLSRELPPISDNIRHQLCEGSPVSCKIRPLTIRTWPRGVLMTADSSVSERLCLLTEETEELAEVAADQSEIQTLSLRVLVIEDSLDALNMLKLWLSSFGCEVMIAVEAMEGVRLAAESPPDLIISDIGMPDLDGYELM